MALCWGWGADGPLPQLTLQSSWGGQGRGWWTYRHHLPWRRKGKPNREMKPPAPQRMCPQGSLQWAGEGGPPPQQLEQVGAAPLPSSGSSFSSPRRPPTQPPSLGAPSHCHTGGRAVSLLALRSLRVGAGGSRMSRHSRGAGPRCSLCGRPSVLTCPPCLSQESTPALTTHSQAGAHPGSTLPAHSALYPED